MTRLKFIFISIISLFLATACHDMPEFADNPKGNFDALWNTLDRHYCFFNEKKMCQKEDKLENITMKAFQLLY